MLMPHENGPHGTPLPRCSQNASCQTGFAAGFTCSCSCHNSPGRQRGIPGDVDDVCISVVQEVGGKESTAVEKWRHIVQLVLVCFVSEQPASNALFSCMLCAGALEGYARYVCITLEQLPQVRDGPTHCMLPADVQRVMTGNAAVCHVVRTAGGRPSTGSTVQWTVLGCCLPDRQGDVAGRAGCAAHLLIVQPLSQQALHTLLLPTSPFTPDI